MKKSRNLLKEMRDYTNKCISFIGPHGCGKTHYLHTLSSNKKFRYNWHYLDHTKYKHEHLKIFVERHSYNQHMKNVIVLDNCDSLDTNYKKSIAYILERFDNDMYTIICVSTKIIFGKEHKENYTSVIMDQPTDEQMIDVLAITFKEYGIKIKKACHSSKKNYQVLIKKLLAYTNSNMHRLKILCEYICHNIDNKCIDHKLGLNDMHVISNTGNMKLLLNDKTHPEMVKCCDIYRNADNTSGNKYRDNLTIHTRHDMEHMMNVMELFVITDRKDIYDDIIPYFRCVMAIRSNIFL